MDTKVIMPLIGLGKQARVAHSCLRPAIVAWSSKDHFGDDFWWWLTCHRRGKGSDVRVELAFWIGSWNWDEGGRFNREINDSCIAHTWMEARSYLVTLRKAHGFYLPDELLDQGLCWIINQDIAPKLKWDHPAKKSRVDEIEPQ